ncbi:MAG: alpha/beta hydrolase [Polaromonas sp.]|nr:alpha/beta hydrolase [Polaromonas sp.]
MTATPPVWRGYGQAELDRQYNSRGTVPDVAVYLREYAERTRDAKARLDCHDGLRYGPGPDDVLDIYPAAGPAAPVMVFMHGGDWRSLSRQDSGFAAPAFVASGAAFVVLDFTLVPQSTLPAMGAQVRRALHWLAQHVAAYGGDPARIHIAGHSSGANLVGQCLMHGAADAAGPLVKSALMISGLADLEPVRLSFRNDALKLSGQDAEQASLVHQPAGATCPLLVAVGEHETEDYRRQSLALAEHWRAQGRRAELQVLPGRHHFDAVLDWADPASGLFRASRALMNPTPEDAHA